MLKYNRALKDIARGLRNNMTDAEQLLWSHLRRKQLLGAQFYRQKVIENYIVDFYAPSVNLVVEVDGSQHLEPEHQRLDRIRDHFLLEQGLTVLRFDNLLVLTKIDLVVEQIFNWMEERN